MKVLNISIKGESRLEIVKNLVELLDSHELAASSSNSQNCNYHWMIDDGYKDLEDRPTNTKIKELLEAQIKRIERWS